MLDINNSTKWGLVSTKEFKAPFFKGNRYNSIDEQPIDILMNKSLIAVFVNIHKNAPPTWKYAGKINQYVPVNILSAITINTASLKSFNIKLNQINLIIPDKSLSKNYALSYTPAKWFFYAKLTIWEYMENIELTLDDKIAEIRAIAQDINTKVNTINTTITTTDLYGLP